MKMTQVTRKMVQQFHTDLLAEGLMPATADHYLKLMRQSWNLAVEWGMLESSPLTKLALFNPDNRVENLLTDSQLESLVTILRTDANRAVCNVCLYLLSTGCRLNEALAAKWDQVDIENRVWRIPAQNSKSKRVRSVPLNDSALDVLAQVGTQGKSEYLFLSKHDERFQRIHKQWHRIRKQAGLDFLRLHDLRHGFASFLVNSGRTLYEVQQILGHSDPKVTMRYSHLSSKALQEAANTASQMIQGAMRNSKVQPLAPVPKAA
jgi:integrase